MNTKVHMGLKIELKLYKYDNEVNNIAECNLLRDIINPPKHAKNINIHYSLILYGCMNTRKIRARFKKF